MSETDVMKGPPIGALHEVRATFRDPEAMQNAVSQLEMSGFDRADLSLPEVSPPAERASPESGATEVDTEEDARQTRTLHTSGAAAVVRLAAAGIVVATGGAAAPAVAAAVVGGGLAPPSPSVPRQTRLSRRAGNARRRAARWCCQCALTAPTSVARPRRSCVPQVRPLWRRGGDGQAGQGRGGQLPGQRSAGEQRDYRTACGTPAAGTAQARR
jgi:hypothetical protein